MRTIPILLGASSVIAAWLLTSGCVTAFPDYPVQPAAHYAHHCEEDAVTLAVQAVTSASEQRKYFDTNLTRRHILPVFVVIENHNPETSVLVSKEDIGLHGGSSGASEEMLSSGGVGTGIQIVGLALLSIPINVIGGAIVADAENIKHNFRVKELTHQTVSPHEATAGFVYFALPGESTPSDARMSVRVRLLPSNEHKAFLLDVQ
jgi:hypothetical protein